MSRRTGQDGYIEASGKWWVVRWWMDVAGQEARKHMRAKICPISGPGHLSKSQRERRAREIVAESGADTVEQFDKVVRQAQGVTFREQTKWWLDLWSAKIPSSRFQCNATLLHPKRQVEMALFGFLNVADFKDVRAG